MNDIRQKGVTIYLAMLITSAALATALFVSSVLIRELHITKEVADSARAVYVVDSAMEYTLFAARVTKDFNVSGFAPSGTNFTLSTGGCAATVLSSTANATCTITASPVVSLGSVAGCPAVPTCTAIDCTRITAKGAYGNTNRAMEIVYPNC